MFLLQEQENKISKIAPNLCEINTGYAGWLLPHVELHHWLLTG